MTEEDLRLVMPRQPMKAERVQSYLGESWSLGFGRSLFKPDEFEAAFVDADLVQAVIDAADALDDRICEWLDKSGLGSPQPIIEARATLSLALLRYRA